MVRKDKEIKDKDEIDDILRSNYICRIALSDSNVPYIVPMNYGYYSNKLYLHTSNKGKKLDIIKNNNIVCFEVSDSIGLIKASDACDYTLKYRSLVGTGRIFIVDNRDEKIEGLQAIMHQHTKKWNWNFKETDVGRVTILRIDIESLSAKKSHI